MSKFTPTATQMKEIGRVANLAYDRISKTVDFDPHLDKLDTVGLGEFVSRAQGALLDLVAEINRQTAAGVVAAREGTKEEVKEESEEEKVFKYLDGLRESGETNMFGATPYIQQEFGFEKKEASAYLTKWMRTFEGRHPI